MIIALMWEKLVYGRNPPVPLTSHMQVLGIEQYGHVLYCKKIGFSLMRFKLQNSRNDKL